ncbi:MAG: DUF3313 domain-containing protein [Deltaproteobacteria bacterium]|nr:DUF3313 domain-containing protein [Deltaproteobacteria bacterium]
MKGWKQMLRSNLTGVLALCVLLGLAGCATTKQVSVKQLKESGFLGDYSRLTPGDTAKGQAVLRYVNANAQWTRYEAVIIEPVTFWGTDATKLSPSAQQALTTYFRSALETQFGAKMKVVETPGAGVMKIQVAITDAESATPVLRTVSLVVPQARALNTLQSVATGHWAFAGGCQVEARLSDASTGRTLGEMVDRRVGGSSMKAAAQWQWGDVRNAMDSWAAEYAARISAWTTGKAAPGSPPPTT